MGSDGRTAVWRRLLLAFFTIVLAQNFASWWTSYNLIGRTGVSIGGAVRPFNWTIRVRPDSPAYAKGLRTGDVVDASAVTAAERYRLKTGAVLVGRQSVIPRLRNGHVEPISVVAGLGAPASTALQWNAIFGWLGGTFCILIGMLIVWRRAELVEARVLALILVLPNLGINLVPENWTTPYAALDAITFSFGLIVWFGSTLIVTYAMLFTAPFRRARAAFAGVAYAVALIISVLSVANVAGAYTGTLDLTSVIDGPTTAILPLVWLICSSACVGITFAGVRGADRERLGWVIFSLAPFIVSLLGTFAPFGQQWAQLNIALSDIGLIIAPVGLTYALMSRRLLDLSFVINRAAVFTGVSIVVVGTFVLVEWALGEWFGSMGHSTNVFVSAGVALALGLSVRTIHNRVDAVLDNVFFRRRHEDEQALRTFAREAPHITDAATLLERAAQCIDRHANASIVSFKLNSGNGRYDDVDENDPALVALRTTLKVVDLHTIATKLEGEFAYPLFARGRMLGAMVLGPKRSGESYAPDESDAIEKVASAVASSLDVLTLGDPRRADALADGLRSIQESLADIGERLRRLEAAGVHTTAGR